MKTVEQRFNEKTQRIENGCILWTGSILRGYGTFGIDGITHRAHRVAYELFKGPIPQGMYVLHSCDNPACVNTEHLRIGTQAENMQDKKDRGRVARGEKIGASVLTKEKVLEIRSIYKQGCRESGTYALAKKYGVHRTLIGKIISRKLWGHLP